MADSARILIVDDERSLCEFLEILLRKERYVVESTNDPREALTRLDAGEEFDLLLVDLMMPGVGGIEVLDAAKKGSDEIQVVMMTAYATAETAVEAMQKGAYDYVQKPFNVDELRVVIRRALEQQRLLRENKHLRAQVVERYRFHNIIGRSEGMQRVFEIIRRVADTRANVLITGESGTGKELIAKAIHYNSSRRAGPLISVNCGAIPETLIESELFGHLKGAFTGAHANKKGMVMAADHGSLFLDEVAELPVHMQVKLLRVLQERKVRPVGATAEETVDLRVIAATNQEPEEAIRRGTFREDLFYRLNVVRVEVPPLRDRLDDVPLIARHFLERFATEMKKDIGDFAPDAMDAMLAYEYPGNVRELENLVERAVTFENSDRITRASLPPRVAGDRKRGFADSAISMSLPPGGIDLEWTLADIERQLLSQALERTRGHRTEAANLLGISFRSMRYKLDKYDIDYDGGGDEH